MSFSSKLMRLSFGGPNFNSESWSCSMHFTTAGPAPTAAGLSTAVEQYMTSTASFRPLTCKLGFVKFNELDHLTGRYANPGVTDVKYYATPAFAGTMNGLLPQGTSAITLKTDIQRGRGHAGRFYFPGYGAPDGSGHMAAGDRQALANTASTFINSLLLFAPDLTPVVWSKIGDLVHPITSVQVGSVVDTQRRRRSQLVELYTVSSVPIE